MTKQKKHTRVSSKGRKFIAGSKKLTKEQRIDKIWDALIKNPNAKEFVRVLSQIQNGGVSQLYQNDDINGATFQMSESIFFVNLMSPRYKNRWKKDMTAAINLKESYQKLLDTQSELGHEADQEDLDAAHETFQTQTDPIDNSIYSYDDVLLLDIGKNARLVLGRK